jgi:hypothetical protein
MRVEAATTTAARGCWAKKHLDDPTSKNQGSPAKTSLAAEMLPHPQRSKIYFCLNTV